jgi:GH24 family phage-related lysozyme (muramidase)
MKTSQNGIDLIKLFEGTRLVAYKCPAGVWTIGVGHTGKVGKTPVSYGMTITNKQVDALLKADIQKFEKNVNKYNRKYHFNQNQYDALVSFAFNIGSIDQLTNKGKRSIEVIAEKIRLYCRANGKVLAGLQARRLAERKLFLKEVK